MKETAFNLYYLIEDGIIRGRAARAREVSGTDEQKIKELQRHCRMDYEFANKYPVPDGWLVYAQDGVKSPGMSWDTYSNYVAPEMGDSRWFEDIFKALDAPQDPLIVVTCVVDGVVTIEGFGKVK